MVTNAGLAKLSGKMPTYYSHGAKARAEMLAAAITDMNAFFLDRIGVQTEVTLAVLNSNDWKRLAVGPHEAPYGLCFIGGEPQVIFMPATSGGFVFQFMMARKNSIPKEMLKAYLDEQQTTFEAVVDVFVDNTGFHELGHSLGDQYQIDITCHWLSEFVASYFAYAFVSERRPGAKRVFDLLGRPSATKPKYRTLEDFERLYMQVDDPGWYHGMFETRIRELYPKMGLEFLKKLQRRYPAATTEVRELPVPNPVSAVEMIEEMEKIAPGFKAWAAGFR